MGKRSKVLMVVLAVTGICLMALSPVQAKKKIAVGAFDDGSIEHWWGDNFSPGNGIADMLVTSLVSSGRFEVIERAQLENILKEQNLQISGFASGNVQPGQIKGLDVLIVGKITQFTVQKSKMGGKGLGKLGGIGVETTKGICVINARIISISTGSILAAAEGKGESSKSGVSLDNSALGQLDFNSGEFQESVLGAATKKAVDDVVKKVFESAGAPEGKIAAISGDVITLNMGKGEVEVGSVLTVTRPGEKITDPDTGEVLGAEESAVGEIKITEVMDKLSKASPVSGSGFQKGDIVRPKK